MQIKLRIYVTGKSSRSSHALEHLQNICEKELAGQVDLEVIDVLENPEMAEEDKILATPTLIRELPPPLRKIVGDLSDRDKVLVGLDIKPQKPSGPGEAS